MTRNYLTKATMYTLRESYAARRAKNFESLILERFDAGMMNDAVAIIKALKGIDFSNFRTLAAARDAAVADVDDILSGESQKGLIKKIVSLFKRRGENPLNDVLAFCDAIHNFFIELQKYVDAKATGVDNPDEKTLIDIISGEQSQTPSIASMATNSLKIQSLKSLIMNGLKPDKTVQRVSSTNWLKKYLKNNYQGVANEISSATLGKLKKTSETIVNALSNSTNVAKAAAGASSGTKETQQPTSSTPSQSTEPTSSTTGSKQEPSNDGNSSKAKKVAAQTAVEVYKTLHDRFGNTEEDTVKKIIAVLAYNDYIKQ